MKPGIFAKLILVAALSTLCAALPQAMAAAPGLINHQGYITDDAGTPIDGDREMWFLFYDQEIGGSEIWSEGPMTVPVTGGIFHVVLGQTTPITPAHLAGSRWLEVIVDGEYLEPRERIVSCVFAIEAGNADTLDGADAADLEESAEIDADVEAHAADDAAHHKKTTTFADLTDAATDAQVPDDITIAFAATAGHSQSAGSADYATSAGSAGTAGYATSAGDADTVDGQDSSSFADATYVAALEARIASLEALFAGISRDGNDITLSGANFHIVSGSGTTDGAVNGLGNLIVGYNELRGEEDDRTGSHNIVVGMENNYSSFGGLVAGRMNTISADYASVGGGWGNVASAFYSNVSGGFDNEASGIFSSLLGGTLNNAAGSYSSVSGGEGNEASGFIASVTGGRSNTASANYSSVSGGWNNVASGESSSVSGGTDNEASGSNDTVVGDSGKVYVDGTVVH